MRVETREERLERRRRERAEQVAYKLEQEIAVWDPAGISNVTADPFKTLFVARIVSIIYVNIIILSNKYIIEQFRIYLDAIFFSCFYRIMIHRNPN